MGSKTEEYKWVADLVDILIVIVLRHDMKADGQRLMMKLLVWNFRDLRSKWKSRKYNPGSIFGCKSTFENRTSLEIQNSMKIMYRFLQLRR